MSNPAIPPLSPCHTPPLLRFDANSEAFLALRAYTASLSARIGHAPGVFVQTFGCQQNEADSERILGMAEAMGYAAVSLPEEAHLVIFNTCAVREHAELKALSLTGQLKAIKNANPEMIIAVCGCMVAQSHRMQKIKGSYPYVDILYGTGQHHRLPEFLYAHLNTTKRAFYPDPEVMGVPEELPVKRESSFRAWVSVMYGCNNFCTYCVVPYVRGRERSRAKEDILAEVAELAEKGVREITLLGQNVNSYGKDRYEAYGFADLLEDICKIKGDYLVRFMTSHPKDATKRLIDVMAAHSGKDCAPRIARHFHLPLQSGADRVLADMNRRYTRASYLALVRYMREKMPDITLSTDIIVGFPTETEEDFTQTLSMLEEVRYDAFFSFIFSPRLGTPAAQMPLIPSEITQARFARMLKVQNDISLEKNRALIGTEVTVLVEGRSKTDEAKLSGRTEHTRLVHFIGDDALIGKTVTLRITDADTYSLRGTLI